MNYLFSAKDLWAWLRKSIDVTCLSACESNMLLQTFSAGDGAISSRLLQSDWNMPCCTQVASTSKLTFVLERQKSGRDIARWNISKVSSYKPS